MTKFLIKNKLTGFYWDGRPAPDSFQAPRATALLVDHVELAAIKYTYEVFERNMEIIEVDIEFRYVLEYEIESGGIKSWSAYSHRDEEKYLDRATMISMYKKGLLNHGAYEATGHYRVRQIQTQMVEMENSQGVM